MRSKRIEWLDFGKGFTIFAMVLAHTLQMSNVNHSFISYVIFTFIMPVFFAISGYLYHKCDTLYKYKILLYKKISSFVIPYTLFTLLLVLEKIFSYQHISNPVKYIYMPYGYLWFLYSLFFIFLLVGVEDLCCINTYIQIIISIFLLIIQDWLPYQQGPKNINPFAGIFGYLFCFYIGYICRRFNIASHVKLIIHRKYFILSVLCWIFIIYIYNIYWFLVVIQIYLIFQTYLLN